MCEDGLEQEFNSLDAQRLASENYIASQIHENWRLVSKHYDDGGFSGGNLNRPALKELFEDIKAGLIDMVVVYKENVYPGEHEAIIEESVWNQVQEIFKKHEKSGQKVRKTMTPSFLKGLVHCGSCNVLMHQTCSNKKGLQYRYYTCSNHLKYKSCEASQHTFPAEIIEKRVVEEIVRILKSPEVVMSLNRLAERRKEVSKADLMAAIKNLNDVWNFFYQAEQRKIVKLPVNSVQIQNNGLKMNLNLDGLNRLLIELS